MAEESAAPSVEIPPELADRAKAAGWSEDLLVELLQRGARPTEVIRYMRMGASEEQVRQFLAAQGGWVRPPRSTRSSPSARAAASATTQGRHR